MALPHEKTTSRAGKYEPVQVFAPDTISASLTTHSMSGILAVRTTADGTYYINTANGATANVLAGTVIGVGEDVTQLVFAVAQRLELMRY